MMKEVGGGGSIPPKPVEKEVARNVLYGAEATEEFALRIIGRTPISSNSMSLRGRNVQRVHPEGSSSVAQVARSLHPKKR